MTTSPSPQCRVPCRGERADRTSQPGFRAGELPVEFAELGQALEQALAVGTAQHIGEGVSCGPAPVRVIAYGGDTVRAPPHRGGMRYRLRH